jgi:hypothetical protein
VLAQFGHKGNTELSDLVIRFALWVKVCTTFAAAHAHYALSVSVEWCDGVCHDLRPVRAFLKICSKPKNFKIDKLTKRLPVSDLF